MEDGEAFFHLAGDKRVAATMRFDCPRTREESDRILADYLSEGNRTYALRFQPEGKMVQNFGRLYSGNQYRIPTDGGALRIPGKGAASLPRYDGRPDHLSVGFITAESLLPHSIWHTAKDK